MPLRVMIIEDEALIALDLQELLEQAGHTVVGHATSFDEAMKLAGKTKPQVALTDMDLKGGKNGLETAAAIADAYGVTPLFITGRDDYLVRAMALPVQPLGFVSKPFQPDEILSALAAYS